jgi:hypothetical protein
MTREPEEEPTPAETPRNRRPSGGTKALRFSERIKNYATAISMVIPVVAALVLGVVNQFKGEPKADLAYSKLSKQTAAMVDNMDALQQKLSKLEGFHDGLAAGKLEAKLEALQKRYDNLKSGVVNGPKVKIVGPPAPEVKCRPGYVKDDSEKCRPVPRAVAKKVEQDQQKAELLKKKLAEERRRRAELERRKAELMKKMAQQQQQQPARAYKRVMKLPKKLDDIEQKK